MDKLGLKNDFLYSLYSKILNDFKMSITLIILNIHNFNSNEVVYKKTDKNGLQLNIYATIFFNEKHYFNIELKEKYKLKAIALNHILNKPIPTNKKIELQEILNNYQIIKNEKIGIESCLNNVLNVANNYSDIFELLPKDSHLHLPILNSGDLLDVTLDEDEIEDCISENKRQLDILKIRLGLNFLLNKV